MRNDPARAVLARYAPLPALLLALLFSLLLAMRFALPGAHAATAGHAPKVQVDDAWVRGTVEGQTGSGAYMRLTSDQDAQLVGASSPAAEHVEIHEMRTVNDMMTMRRIDKLALPAHVSVALDHDYHVMLIGLRHQLVPGQTVPIALRVIDAQGHEHAVGFSAPVLPLNTPTHAARNPLTPAQDPGRTPASATAPHG